MPKIRREEKDERSPERKGDLAAWPDELGEESVETGADSAGHGTELQDLSTEEEISDESVEELADSDQSFESEFLDGSEDAADHPERPTHTHDEYGNPEDAPPIRGEDEAA